MQVIAKNVYIEDQYPGVTLGAISLAHGLIQIDAPPSPEDGRSWRASMLNLNSGVERLLINLDAHPDRTLGVRAMDCTVVAHEKTAQAFRNRPNTFKAQGDETGADWELVAGMGSVRWSPPEISFTSRMAIEWSNLPVLLDHHPGPTQGAIWATLPDLKIVFVGDLVTKDQPPFLAFSNIPEWLSALDTLLADYPGFTIISGRGGIITHAAIQEQRDLLETIESQLETLAQKQAAPEATEALVQPLLVTLDTPFERQKQFGQRLAYGLRHYYARRYRPTAAPETEEE
jgi:glyoxylase-like metal-dependent hydrolase (beta-lactamase superfamily II)